MQRAQVEDGVVRVQRLPRELEHDWRHTYARHDNRKTPSLTCPSLGEN